MTSNHHALYDLGYTCCNGVNKGKRACEGKQIPKITSQFGLQSATRLHEAESLVIAIRMPRVNTFLVSVHTARHTMGVSNARSQ